MVYYHLGVNKNISRLCPGKSFEPMHCMEQGQRINDVLTSQMDIKTLN